MHYRVKNGDTIYRIADDFGTTVDSILTSNNNITPEKLLPGQILFIPRGKSTQKRGLWDIFTKKALESENTVSDNKDNLIDQPNKFAWPTESPVISSSYGKRGRSFHNGLDISAKSGSSVFAADSGVVIYSDNGVKGYGNLIIVKHTSNISTVYAHNQKNLVKKGDLVKKGQKIALVGRTGNASGSHLHFEVRDGKVARNPLLYLPQRQVVSKK